MIKKTITLDKQYSGPEMFTVEILKEVFREIPCFIMPKVRDWIRENNKEKTFEKGETITIPTDKIDYLEIAENELKEDTENEISENVYDAWTLTKDGKLNRGSTGYFKDENGLYILKDGRRASYDHLNKIKSFDLIIGDKDVQKGLNDILGITDINAQESFSSLFLLNNINKDDPMKDVAYQAFQINVCYTKDKQNVTSLNSNTAFFHIGTDEMGIPIVATRIGNVNSDNILVIAGPHGDERNAQRLILWSQIQLSKSQRFDWLYYFIPCISPTAAFADIRGFPKEHINTSHRIVEYYSASITPTEYGNLLYDISKKGNENREENNLIINTNRDCVNKSLISTEHFMVFSVGLIKNNKNVFGIFLHGYDRSGRVYPSWEMRNGMAYALYYNEAENICRKLFGHKMWYKEYFGDTVNTNNDKRRNDYYKSNFGEYVGHEGVPLKSFDIELMEALNEGRSNEYGGNIPPYISKKDIRKDQTMNGLVRPEIDNTEQKNEFIQTINTDVIRSKFHQLLLRFSEVN